MTTCGTKVYLTEEVMEELEGRLNRIEGQVRGISQMIEEHRDCESILIQFASAKAALSGAMVRLLEGHIESCVLEDVRAGRGESAIKNLGGALAVALRKL